MPNEEGQPFISVIMPVRNEAAHIRASLGAVLAQDYPAEFVEVLIADGMSTDDTLDQIQQLSGAERVRIFANPRLWQAPGLNMLIREARGDIIARVDGHTVIAPDYLRRCVEALQTSGADEVGGAISPVGLTSLAATIALACRSAFAVPGAFHVGKQAQFVDTVYLGAWPREVLIALSGFQERLRANEDYELNIRLRQRGGTIYYSPTIRSTYFGRQSVSSLAEQYLLYGRAKTSVLRQHPTSLRLRQVIAPAFVAALILGGIGAMLNAVLAWMWLVMVSAYLCLCLAFTLLSAQKGGRAMLWLMPCIFFIIHLSWGFGFWIGWFERPYRAAPQATA